jgi:hypothetical protein
MGVRRVSTGGAIAARTWAAFIDVARELKESETFDAFSRPGPSIGLNGLFAG